MYKSTNTRTHHKKGVSGQRRAQAALTPGKRPDTHSAAGWEGLGAGRRGSGKSRTYRGSNPGTTNS
jgi:hypothetical protein